MVWIGFIVRYCQTTVHNYNQTSTHQPWIDVWEDGISSGGRYFSLGEGAACVSLGAVHMEGVQVRVQVECGREEVNRREKHGERQNEEATRNGRSNAHHG